MPHLTSAERSQVVTAAFSGFSDETIRALATAQWDDIAPRTATYNERERCCCPFGLAIMTQVGDDSVVGGMPDAREASAAADKHLDGIVDYDDALTFMLMWDQDLVDPGDLREYAEQRNIPLD